MKTMNAHEDKQLNLKEKLIRGAGDRLAQMATEPRCWNMAIYEPSLSSEMINEMLDQQ